MGFQNGLCALHLIAFLSISCLIPTCHNSKITFPTEGNMDHSELSVSPTNASIVSETSTLPSSQEGDSGSLSSGSRNSTSLFSLFFGDGESNDIVEDRSQLSLRDKENEIPETKGFVRSLEITDSREVYNPDRRLRDSMEDRWNGWNFEEKNSKWRYPPDEKTIQLQVLDEDPYHHGRPAWPHDEYLLGYFDLKGSTPERSNGSVSSSENYVDSTLSPDEASKYYEWKRLQPRPSPSAFIGPGFYDVSSIDPAPSGDYYRYHQPSFQAITTDGTGKVQTTGSSSSGGGSSTEQGSGVPGTPSESNTNTRHFPAYAAYDYYKRKRLRLQIHPGLIAAPLAGLAAFGAASALTSKPLLVELGYVRNKPDLVGGGGYPGGWGWAGNQGTGYRPYPPFYPPPNPPPIYPPIGVGTGSVGPHYPGGGGLGFGGGIAHGGASHSAGGGGGPIYPILKPIRHRPESERSSWWNPFSALTPRLVIE